MFIVTADPVKDECLKLVLVDLGPLAKAEPLDHEPCPCLWAKPDQLDGMSQVLGSQSGCIRPVHLAQLIDGIVRLIILTNWTLPRLHLLHPDVIEAYPLQTLGIGIGILKPHIHVWYGNGNCDCLTIS